MKKKTCDGLLFVIIASPPPMDGFAIMGRAGLTSVLAAGKASRLARKPHF